MIFLVITVYVLIYIFDYSKTKKIQSKKQNIMYISLLVISFLLLSACVLDFHIPILSDLIRHIIKK